MTALSRADILSWVIHDRKKILIYVLPTIKVFKCLKRYNWSVCLRIAIQKMCFHFMSFAATQ